MSVVSIELTEDQMAWISNKAKQRGKSISQWILDQLYGFEMPDVGEDETYTLSDLEDDLKEISSEKVYHSADELFEDLDCECA
ncbi:MAG: hypothetical protein LBF26_02510 [Puniceicoccales bacterium]|jgi:hypothetical protein|nr:hypothetical protein [Puniceicoccales bacterium]